VRTRTGAAPQLPSGCHGWPTSPSVHPPLLSSYHDVSTPARRIGPADILRLSPIPLEHRWRRDSDSYRHGPREGADTRSAGIELGEARYNGIGDDDRFAREHRAVTHVRDGSRSPTDAASGRYRQPI